MKVSKRTMNVIEKIAIVLIMLCGISFILSSIAMAFDWHAMEYICIVVACFSAVLAMGCIVFEPA